MNHPLTKDRRGHVYSYLTAMELTDRRATGSVVWRCRCVCGTTVFRSGRQLSEGVTVGRVMSCGCKLATPDDEYRERIKQKILRDSVQGKTTYRDNPCWNYTRFLDRDGYGLLRFRRTSMRTNRAAYWAFKGNIPDGIWVLHHCDNPSCVNPDHLYLGTLRENTYDMVARNRQAKGSHQGSAKLTEEQARTIKDSVEPTRTLSHRFQISYSAIQRIRNGRGWRHLCPTT